MEVPAAAVRFASLARLKRDDIKTLRKMAGPIRSCPAGYNLQIAGEPTADPILLLSGWATSSIALANGGRQIVKMHLPGDLLGLTSVAFTHCIDTVVAVTEVQVCAISQAAIGKLFGSHPRLAAVLFLISLEERGALSDRLLMLGRAETGQRIAALILQLRDRLSRTDPTLGLSFPIPITQLHLADMVGATTVHVSRVIQDLGARHLLKWERGKITILDLDGLRTFAGLPARELAQNADWLPAA